MIATASCGGPTFYPFLIETVRGYLGEGFRLTDAKEWHLLAIGRDFHGWLGDASKPRWGGHSTPKTSCAAG